MARPFKEGLDYFPLDVDFLEDKKVKLIKAEFGSKGILVLISLLMLVYKSNGYFYQWDKDDCLLMSDGVGCGCGPEFIQEVLQGCIRRSIFDEGVFDMFKVITSAGIQKRFLNAISERKNTTIIKEYLLVNLSDEKVCPPGTLKKLTINSINPQINTVNPPINLVKPPINPKSKVKESKGKKKEICEASSHTHRFLPPTSDEVKAYCNEKGYSIDSDRFINFYESKNWMVGKNKMTNWKAALANWHKNTNYQYSQSKTSNRENLEQRTYDNEFSDNFFTNMK